MSALRLVSSLWCLALCVAFFPEGALAKPNVRKLTYSQQFELALQKGECLSLES